MSGIQRLDVPNTGATIAIEDSHYCFNGVQGAPLWIKHTKKRIWQDVEYINDGRIVEKMLRTFLKHVDS